jgi:hypothetical protein
MVKNGGDTVIVWCAWWIFFNDVMECTKIQGYAKGCTNFVVFLMFILYVFSANLLCYSPILGYDIIIYVSHCTNLFKR